VPEEAGADVDADAVLLPGENREGKSIVSLRLSPFAFVFAFALPFTRKTDVVVVVASDVVGSLLTAGLSIETTFRSPPPPPPPPLPPVSRSAACPTSSSSSVRRRWRARTSPHQSRQVSSLPAGMPTMRRTRSAARWGMQRNLRQMGGSRRSVCRRKAYAATWSALGSKGHPTIARWRREAQCWRMCTRSKVGSRAVSLLSSGKDGLRVQEGEEEEEEGEEEERRDVGTVVEMESDRGRLL